MRRLGILVISDRASQGLQEDRSGAVLREWAEQIPMEVAAFEIIPDEQPMIEKCLRLWADQQLDLVLTTGGTGLSPRDVTPEATEAVVDRFIPGIPEFVRIRTVQKTPLAVLSRAVAGLKGKTLIINLPGSPKGVTEWLACLDVLLEHTFSMIEGKTHDQADKAAAHSDGHHD